MNRLLNVAVLTAALTTPVALVPLAMQAQDHPHSYQDREHKDEHQWNSREDRAYRIWAKENHRKYRDFAKLKEEERQSYWGWRHEHSDAVLKIDIR